MGHEACVAAVVVVYRRLIISQQLFVKQWDHIAVPVPMKCRIFLKNKQFFLISLMQMTLSTKLVARQDGLLYLLNTIKNIIPAPARD
jgi:hypothetical protein